MIELFKLKSFRVKTQQQASIDVVINYISQAEGDQAYDVIGNNCITSNNTFYLDTKNKNYKYTIYRYNTGDITLDNTALNEYIKQSSSLIVGGIFKTNITPERQYRGHYGITFNLRFLDNTSNHDHLKEINKLNKIL